MIINERPDPFVAYEVLFNHTPKLAGIRRMVDRVSQADVPVLITGETGTGKELLARIIHLKSRTKEKPFIKVNCAAIPHTLLESELFGYERGAFTGAIGRKPGKFELAGGGTIFLDEIGEMDLAVQPKVLQVLQNGEFSHLGGTEDLKTNARVIAATNVDLEKRVQSRTFREDLFYRLNVIQISIPPLRERKEQLPFLVDYFLGLYGRCRDPLSEKTANDFARYDWPGNIRELENRIRRIAILSDEQGIDLSVSEGSRPCLQGVIPPEIETHRRESHHACSLKVVAKEAARKAEREAISQSLTRNQWNRKVVARELEISYKALLYKIKDCGLIAPLATENGETRYCEGRPLWEANPVVSGN